MRWPIGLSYGNSEKHVHRSITMVRDRHRHTRPHARHPRPIPCRHSDYVKMIECLSSCRQNGHRDVRDVGSDDDCLQKQRSKLSEGEREREKVGNEGEINI